MSELNEQQKMFVQEYIVDLNATKAAIRAGYSEKSAHVTASRLLSDAKIQTAVQKVKQDRADRLQITQVRVLREIARVGFSDLRNVMTPDGQLVGPLDWDDDTAAAISSLEVARSSLDGQESVVERTHKIKTWDKNAALEKLCKHLGLYAPEQHEHTGKDWVPLIPEMSDTEVARRIAFLLQKGQQDG